MHKVQDTSSASPFRPIVSSIGTWNYSLEKFLCFLLDPYLPNNFCVRDTFSFVNEITSLSTSGMFTISFDLESLFTNIPFLEAIDLAIQYVLKGDPDIKLKGMVSNNCFSLPRPRPISLFRVFCYVQVLPWAAPLHW